MGYSRRGWLLDKAGDYRLVGPSHPRNPEQSHRKVLKQPILLQQAQTKEADQLSKC